MRKITVLLLLLFLLCGCSVKQGQLVILDNQHENNVYSEQGIKLEKIDENTPKMIIEKNAELIKNLDPSLSPLSVSPDFSTIIAFKFTGNSVANDLNKNLVCGNMIQEMNLYAVNVENKAIVSIGKYMSIKDLKYDESGRRIAFIDGLNNIYVYDLDSKKASKMVVGRKHIENESVCWSKDSKRLMINTRSEFDIASKQFISIAVDSYTPFIKRKFSNTNYIVQMKNDDYRDMIAFYDFTNKSYKSIATGIYMDSDNVNLIYTRHKMYGLYVSSMKTLESKVIEENPIYCANIMKRTGEVVYTTLNSDVNNPNKYFLIKYDPRTNTKKYISTNTPTFYLSPGEDKLYFVSDYWENSLAISTEDLAVAQSLNKVDEKDLAGIKSTILKSFQLDYSFKGSVDFYELEAKKVYTNTYTPLPQEALENKLVDFKRFNVPLPTYQAEDHMPPYITISDLYILGNRASLNLGFFYTNAIEMVKTGDSWYITGFSTHPDSIEIRYIRATVQKYLTDLILKDRTAVMNYFSQSKDEDFNASQEAIVDMLLANAENNTIEIGEIELWSAVDPHRAEDTQSATSAKVKIILHSKDTAVKYKLILNRVSGNEFAIHSWNTDPLSISQLR